MPTIINIGYTHFLVAKSKDAAVVIEALASAIEMECDYKGDHLVYFPRTRKGQIGMVVVAPEHIVRAPSPAPEAEEVEPPKPKLLKFK